MSRSYCSYDQDSDSFAVTVKKDGLATCYRAPGHFIRQRFDWQAPKNGDELAHAIEFAARGLGAK